jgi:integrase
MNDLILKNSEIDRPGSLEEITRKVREYISNERAQGTKRSYKTAWDDFTAFCEKHGATPLPAEPEVVACYLTHLAENHKVSTIETRQAAIRKAHILAGHPSPTKHPAVMATIAGIRREKGVLQKGKAPLLTDNIRAMVAAVPQSLLGKRDKAIILIGFSGAYRRSEIVGLNIEDLEYVAEGVTITLRRSKTDQEGQGYKKAIPKGHNPETCPVEALREWIEAAKIESGAIFRTMNRSDEVLETRLSDRGVARVVQRLAEAVGLDVKLFAGHSLRAGLATQAAINGTSERVIMKQTGHIDPKTVRRYIRDTNLYRENAAKDVGL